MGFAQGYSVQRSGGSSICMIRAGLNVVERTTGLKARGRSESMAWSMILKHAVSRRYRQTSSINFRRHLQKKMKMEHHLQQPCVRLPRMMHVHSLTLRREFCLGTNRSPYNIQGGCQWPPRGYGTKYRYQKYQKHNNHCRGPTFVRRGDGADGERGREVC